MRWPNSNKTRRGATAYPKQPLPAKAPTQRPFVDGTGGTLIITGEGVAGSVTRRLEATIQLGG